MITRGSTRNHGGFMMARGSLDFGKTNGGSCMTLDSNLFREKLLLNRELKNQRMTIDEKDK